MGASTVPLPVGGGVRGSGLRAAAVVVDITPPAGHAMGGYLARTLEATDTHDPLTASLVWIADESGELLWVALDALAVGASTSERIRAGVGRAVGVDPDSIVVCASHTHAGPSGWLRPLYDGFPSTLDEVLVDVLVERVTAAAAGLRPVSVRPAWSVVGAVGVGTNRNDRSGPHDDSTGVLTLQSDAGPVAVLADYACHPTVLSHANRTYSADYPGVARRVAAAALRTAGQPAPVVAFLQGAAGDVSTRFTRRGQSFAEVDRLGGVVGAAIARGALLGRDLSAGATAAARADSCGGPGGEPGRAPGGWPGIGRVRRACVELPTRTMPPIDQLDRDLAVAEREWGAACDPAPPAARIARTRYEGARMLAALSAAELPPTLQLPISVVTLGEVAWVHLPVEPFASYGAAIAAASPYPATRVVGYSDGYFGYLADAEAHAAGSYEARASLFDPAAGPLLVEAAIDLLNRR
ncbi:MAG TPA: neutral/alkaline non-lysosomal ceramidase N-terminal domain-containing protein [Mycobacteriales bacterium]|nr:neutral/alkaline non-lysosomal ceramidase N-terminal domain-containing protein [Mycobacteriales bacterium]